MKYSSKFITINFFLDKNNYIYLPISQTNIIEKYSIILTYFKKNINQFNPKKLNHFYIYTLTFLINIPIKKGGSPNYQSQDLQPMDNQQSQMDNQQSPNNQQSPDG